MISLLDGGGGRCGLTNAQYRGTKISFTRHAHDLSMKHGISLAVLAAVITFPGGGGVKASFIDLPLAFFVITKQRSSFPFNTPV